MQRKVKRFAKENEENSRIREKEEKEIGKECEKWPRGCRCVDRASLNKCVCVFSPIPVFLFRFSNDQLDEWRRKRKKKEEKKENIS